MVTSKTVIASREGRQGRKVDEQQRPVHACVTQFKFWPGPRLCLKGQPQPSPNTRAFRFGRTLRLVETTQPRSMMRIAAPSLRVTWQV